MPPRQAAPAPTDFDRRKFVSAAAAQLYDEHLKNKKGIPERGFEPPEGSKADFTRIIEQRGWIIFTQQPEHSVPSLVREFYANFSENEEGRVTVRQKVVDFSPAAINRFYALPDIPDDEYNAYLAAGVNLDEVTAEICRRPATWEHYSDGRRSLFKTADLKWTSHVWYHFIMTRLMPSTHISEIYTEHAVVLYAIREGKTIDVGNMIYNSVVHCLQANKRSLYFPSLITALCRQAGIVPHRRDGKESPMIPITDSIIEGIIKKKPSLILPDPPAPDAPPADGPADPAAAPDAPPAYEDRINMIERDIHLLQGDVHSIRGQMTYMSQIMRRMAQHHGVDISDLGGPSGAANEDDP